MIAYAFRTQERLEVDEFPKSAEIAGNATLTMNRSRLAMKSPTDVINRIFQRLSTTRLLHSNQTCISQGTVAKAACKRQGSHYTHVHANRSLCLTELLDCSHALGAG